MTDSDHEPRFQPQRAPRGGGARDLASLLQSGGAEAEGAVHLYRRLVDQIEAFAIFLLDPGGHVMTWNAGAERIQGYRADEILGRHFSVLYPPEDVARGRPEAELAEARAHGRFQEEGWRVRKDGTRFWSDVVTTAIRDTAGDLIGFAKVARDRTDRKSEEEALRLAEEARQLERERQTRAAAEAAERRASFLARASEILGASLEYENTLASVTRLVVPQIADGCGIFLLGEDGALRPIGLAHVQPSRAERLRAVVEREAPPEARGVDYAALLSPARVVSFANPSEVDLEAITRDAVELGAVRALESRSGLVVPLVAHERVIGLMAFVTGEGRPPLGPRDQGVVEDLARRASIAIENAWLYRQVREADRRKDQWLAMLAHELRNPLTTVVTSLHILRMSRDDPRQAEASCAMIERQVRHLSHLLDDLLDVSRISRGRIRIRRERLDLVKAIRTASEDRRVPLAQAGLELSLELAAEPLWIAGDAVRLTQIVNNLLDNAVKFKGRGREVKVRLMPDRAHHDAVLEIEDQGVGIEPETLPLLFDPFAQGRRRLDRVPGGLGLGLATVKGLVELHGGSVVAESAGSGAGARFTIRLPLKQEPTALTDLPRTGVAPAARSLRILVIEDNLDAAQSLRVLLELLGHEIQVAHNGHEGVRMAGEWDPDVVLCDIGLPGLDGYEVAAELRARPPTTRTRLIAVTGYGQDSDRQRSQTAGFDHHLVKPVDPTRLQELLSLARS